MSEKRTIEQIYTEYAEICSKAGNAQYQIQVIKNDLAILNEKMRDLNIEAMSVKNAGSKEKENA